MLSQSQICLSVKAIPYVIQAGLNSPATLCRYFTMTVNIVPSSTNQSLCMQQKRDVSSADVFPNSGVAQGTTFNYQKAHCSATDLVSYRATAQQLKGLRGLETI